MNNVLRFKNNALFWVNHQISKSLLFVLAIILVYSPTFSQDTTKTHHLPEFSISEKLDAIFSKINTQEIDSNVLALNNSTSIATLLSKNSGVTVKSYGVTGLSSVSMRGGNSNHTAVLWNGFNLQDPLNGGFNFSSSGVNFIDDVNIQYGGGSSAFGSGAIGGTIHLNNKPTFSRKLFGSIQYKNGSFNLNTINAEVGYGGNKIATRLRLFKNNTKNNFTFKNNAKIDKPIEEYENAQLDQYGLLHEAYYKLNDKQLISSQLWFQYNFREIPPNITSSSENLEEYQKDKWYRWALNWNKKGDKVNYEARNGLFYNTLNYRNEGIDLDVNHSSLKNITEVLAKVHWFKNQKTTIGINNNYTVGISENYSSPPSLNTTAIYLAPSFTILKKITLNTSLREEIYAGELKPITYSINGKYNFYRGFYLSASFSKNHRTPTFNDLFWSSGFARGNLNLSDEYGYSNDIGLGLNLFTEKTTIKSNVSFYQNKINNLIQWIPEGQSWTPTNAKLVETKGVEFALSSEYKIFKNLKLNFNLTYAYTSAKLTEKAENESEDVLFKQLIYTPYYQGNTLIGLSYKNISLNTSIQYVGFQFTRADNLDWISAYTLTDIGTYYRLNLKKNTVIFSGKINNVFDVIYEVRQWYPMPKNNYEVGIKIIIN